ncbi:MAG: sulfatase [Verrucomicrobiales bacterium]|nr:sulfatase [Verrucomicrobiales bacterium]
MGFWSSVIATILLCVSASAKAAADKSASGPGKPNVLFIAIDDLRPEMGCYGNAEVKTPNLDRLASTGLRLDRAYCQYAICGPSRASLLTGLRPDTLKIEEIDTFFRNTVPDVVTLPQHFKANGYESLYVGKVFHPGQTDDDISWSRPVRQPPRGSEYQLPESLEVMKKRRQEAEAKYGKEAQLQGMSAGPAWESAEAPDSAYPDCKTADAAIATLREVKDKPFFLGVGFIKPHLPFVAPKKYFDLYDPATLTLTDTPNPPKDGPAIARHSSFELRTRTRVPTAGPIDEPTSRELLRAYYACASFVDAQIGRVLAELDSLGLRENTIIVVWGDHGWHLGEYGIWGKATNYEVATRVPLIVSAPEMKAAGRGSKALVEFVDVYPTLCELAGLQKPAHLQGKSFAPLLTDPEQKWKDAAFSQFPSPALREWAARPLSDAMRGSYFSPVIKDVEAQLAKEHGDRYDAQLFNNDLMGYSIRTDRYRYTAWVDRRSPTGTPFAEELYDHESDSHETVNVAAERPAICSKLRQQLFDHP